MLEKLANTISYGWRIVDFWIFATAIESTGYPLKCTVRSFSRFVDCTSFIRYFCDSTRTIICWPTYRLAGINSYFALSSFTAHLYLHRFEKQHLSQSFEPVQFNWIDMPILYAIHKNKQMHTHRERQTQCQQETRIQFTDGLAKKRKIFYCRRIFVIIDIKEAKRHPHNSKHPSNKESHFKQPSKLTSMVYTHQYNNMWAR